MPYSPGTNTAQVGAIGGALGGGAVDGSILYVGAGAVLAQDNANLFYDAANARLGIRTNTPAAALHIAAGANGGLQVDDSVTLGANGGTDTLTINTPTITLGANITQTRSSGAPLATGPVNVQHFISTVIGDAGGATSPRGITQQLNLSGANALNSAAASLNILSDGPSGNTSTATVCDTFYTKAAGAAVTAEANLFRAASPTITSGTVTSISGLRVRNLGNASIGTAVGLRVEDFSASTVAMRGIQLSLSSGAGKHNIYIDGSAASYHGSPFRIGTTTAIAVGGINDASLSLAGSSGSGASGQIGRFSNDNGGPFIQLYKSRNAVVGGNTIVQSADPLGIINFCGADGVNFTSIGASIVAAVDGVPGAGSMPGRLTFSTTASGAAFATERLRISTNGNINISNGKLYPPSDAAALQTSAAIYAGNGAPNNANGANGDFYLRGDGTVAGNTIVYHKEGGAWVAATTT